MFSIFGVMVVLNFLQCKFLNLDEKILHEYGKIHVLHL